jgi:hypothetical protein
MAIQSASEFEAVVGHVRMRVERALSERGSVASLENTIRDLERIVGAARQPAKLKALRGKIEELTDLLSVEIPNDDKMLERLWDLADYVDYRT